MQIPSIPPIVSPHALPQDVVAKAVPNVQSAPPIIATAVNPAVKPEKFNQVNGDKDKQRRNRDNNADRDDSNADEGDCERGQSVNISV